jgi:hypothetical protein
MKWMSPGGAMDRPNFLLADKCYIVHHKLIHKKKRSARRQLSFDIYQINYVSNI